MTTLPKLGDYNGWAQRFLETCRKQHWGVLQAMPELRKYADAVRDETATEVGRWGADPRVVRNREAQATVAITHWINEAEREFGPGYNLGDPRLPDFLATVFRNVRISQIRDVIDEAGYQAAKAYERNAEDQVVRWRNAETALQSLLERAELDLASERAKWIDDVRRFTEQISTWAQERAWKIATRQLQRSEELLGDYEVPMLIIQTDRGAVMVEPGARVVIGATGRIDMYAYPTLFRVMLLRSSRTGEWRIRTDSGVFLRQQWNKDTFFDLVQDLTGAA